MRSLDSARDSWTELKQYDSLTALRRGVRLDGRASVCNDGLRSVCWKAFLLFDSVEIPSWPRTLASSRSAYDSLRMHFLQHLEHPDGVDIGGNPLHEDENSRWVALQKDEELRAEIKQDVDRCMPENLYFRQQDTQRLLLDILFIYCKLNPDTSYRQGMHELLAPILWVIERDAINLGQSNKAMGEDAVIKTTFDAEYVEHDAFALFSQVMQNAKSFYEQTTHTALENPMIVRSRRIISDLLAQVDPELSQHLEKIDIIPQVFLMRWIRLLFGREFAFEAVLTIWDVIFAEDPTLEIVDFICITMLLRLHWEILDADYNSALTILLQYPSPQKDVEPQSLALDALYLRDHMNIEGGSHLVLKYTGRPLQKPDRPTTPPMLQRNITAFSGVNVAKAALQRSGQTSSNRIPRQPLNLEVILQTTAKNLYTRGEQLGIGKVVRSAVDEVHRKAQEIRDTHTPSPPANWRSSSSRSTTTLVAKVKGLENRSLHLGKLLDSAVSELWDFQKLVADAKETSMQEKSTVDIDLEGLSMAIAKVQFVQVYLQDVTLPLDGDEVSQDATLASESHEPDADIDEKSMLHNALQPPDSSAHPRSGIVEGLADPLDFEDEVNQHESSHVATHSSQDHDKGILTRIASPDLGNGPDGEVVPPSRPPLAESAYSWMLGQNDGSMKKPPKPMIISDAQPGRGFLFGHVDNEAQVGTSTPKPNNSRQKKRNNINRVVPASVSDSDTNDFGRLSQDDESLLS